MNMSCDGRRVLLEAFEGLRLDAYRDCVGVWTVGYGHSARLGRPPVRPGMRVTAAGADAILARDLALFETGVGGLLRVAPMQREFDAFVDFAYNAGLGALRASSMLRAFNRGDKQGSAQGLLAWDRCGGRVVAGLTRRRAAERAWFLGVAPGAPPAAIDMAHAVDPADPIAARVANRIALAARRRARP